MKTSKTVIARSVSDAAIHISRCWIASLALAMTIWGYPAQAQSQNNTEPLEVTAAESLDWDRTNKIFIARIDAIATQGEASIAAAMLTANYRDEDDQNFNIWQIEATSNVIITSKDSKAYGDHAIYNLDTAFATMTGHALKLTSPDQTVTARDKFDYYVEGGRLEAHGQAKVIRLEDTLEADLIIAHMKDNAEGQRVLDRMEAKGHVVITTPTEIARGSYGLYRADTNKATLEGGVTITRGPNILQGNKAEIDLTTNTSRMFGGNPASGGRVRGVFYPGSEKMEAP